MSLAMPNISDELILSFILGQKNASNLQYLKLYKNDYVPTRETILTDLVEADQSGYSTITLDQSNWDVDVNTASAIYPEQIFYIQERASIYGYYVTTIIDSTEYLMWLERFTNAPFQFPPIGGSIAINLNLNIQL